MSHQGYIEQMQLAAAAHQNGQTVRALNHLAQAKRDAENAWAVEATKSNVSRAAYLIVCWWWVEACKEAIL